MSDYFNSTQYGIKNDAERYVYGGWLVFVALCALLGDTVILVSSIKYNAFKIHEIVTAFIQHMAVCDLLTVAGNILPITVSLICDSEGSSSILNYFRFSVNFYLHSVSSFLISAMTLGKLILLIHPLRTVSWSKMQAHKFSAGIWATLTCVPVLHLFIDKDDVVFDYRVYAFMYKYSSKLWDILSPIFVLLTFFLPNIITVVSTILLLKEAKAVAREARQTLRWQGIMAVILTAIINTLSLLPIVTYTIVGRILKDPHPFHEEFYRVAYSALYANVLAHFFVMNLTVASFRGLLKSKLRQIAFLLTGKVTPIGKL